MKNNIKNLVIALGLSISAVACNNGHVLKMNEGGYSSSGSDGNNDYEDVENTNTYCHDVYGCLRYFFPPLCYNKKFFEISGLQKYHTEHNNQSESFRDSYVAKNDIEGIFALLRYNAFVDYGRNIIYNKPTTVYEYNDYIFFKTECANSVMIHPLCTKEEFCKLFPSFQKNIKKLGKHAIKNIPILEYMFFDEDNKRVQVYHPAFCEWKDLDLKTFGFKTKFFGDKCIYHYDGKTKGSYKDAVEALKEHILNLLNKTVTIVNNNEDPYEDPCNNDDWKRWGCCC